MPTMTADRLAVHDAACRTTHAAALVAAEALRTTDLAVYTAAYSTYTEACAAYAAASDAAYDAKREALAQEAR